MEKYSVAIITLSDKAAQGLREDLARPTIEKVLEPYPFEVIFTKIIPDEFDQIVLALEECCNNHIALVLTTGGTGLSFRDVTPEATKKVIEKEVPGVAEAMRIHSYQYTNRAILSRGICGIKDQTLILNLPGSPKACQENLTSVIQPLVHGIETLLGQGGECGR